MNNKTILVVGVSILLILVATLFIFRKYKTENVAPVATSSIELNDPCAQLDENSCYLNDMCMAQIQCGKTKDGQEMCLYEYKGCRTVSSEEQSKQNKRRDLCVSTNGEWERNISHPSGHCNCKPTADGKIQGFTVSGCAVY